MAQKLYGLNHLRALAISLVFFYHYFLISGGEPEWLPDIADFGWTGVELFFVLSGFLISSQLFLQIRQGQSISFSRFFLKRFFRIIPAFLVTVALYFCIPFFREKEALPPLWKFLTFTQNLGLNLNKTGTFSHAWSLCVEEHFYFLLPLVLIVLQRTNNIKRGYWLLIILFIMGLLIKVYSYHELYLPKIKIKNSWSYWYQYIYYPSYTRVDGLLTGVSIAAIYHFLPDVWRRLSRFANLFILLSIAILTGAYFFWQEEQSFYTSVFGFPLIALGYGCLLIGAVSEKGFLYKWKSQASTFIATLSYAVYLTHKGVIHMTRQLLEDRVVNENLILLISVITCLAAALLMHVIIEKPFLRLRDKIVKS
jgi:peptidoglycan/LPS O-acetylase OafA/YrhL